MFLRIIQRLLMTFNFYQNGTLGDVGAIGDRPSNHIGKEKLAELFRQLSEWRHFDNDSPAFHKKFSPVAVIHSADNSTFAWSPHF